MGKNRIQDNSALMGHLYYNGKEVSAVLQSGDTYNYPKENPKQEFNLLGFNFQALVHKCVTLNEKWGKK